MGKKTFVTMYIPARSKQITYVPQALQPNDFPPMSHKDFVTIILYFVEHSPGSTRKC